MSEILGQYAKGRLKLLVHVLMDRVAQEINQRKMARTSLACLSCHGRFPLPLLHHRADKKKKKKGKAGHSDASLVVAAAVAAAEVYPMQEDRASSSESSASMVHYHHSGPTYMCCLTINLCLGHPLNIRA